MPDEGAAPRLRAMVVWRAVLESEHIVSFLCEPRSKVGAIASFSASLGVLVVPRYSPVWMWSAGPHTPAAACESLAEPSV